MTGARGEYPRPDMTQAAGARADGPELETPNVEEIVETARKVAAGVTFWDRIAQSHRRLGRRGR